MYKNSLFYYFPKCVFYNTSASSSRHIKIAPEKCMLRGESEMVLNDIDYKIRTLSYSPVDVSAAISFELFKETFGHLIGIFEYLLFPQRW